MYCVDEGEIITTYSNMKVHQGENGKGFQCFLKALYML